MQYSLFIRCEEFSSNRGNLSRRNVETGRTNRAEQAQPLYRRSRVLYVQISHLRMTSGMTAGDDRRALPPDCFVIMTALRWRYRLGVRTEDSQSSNTGSIPVSATNFNLPDINHLRSGLGLSFENDLSHGSSAKSGYFSQSGDFLKKRMTVFEGFLIGYDFLLESQKKAQSIFGIAWL